MISLSALTGASTGNYYVSLCAEDYYVHGGEPPGKWFGKGAALLGLEGKVQSESFRNLIRGFAPDGSKKLVNNAGAKNRQSGQDVVFTAPKSLSVLWALLPAESRKQIQVAHEEAVKSALSFCEKSVLYSRRGHAGHGRERVGLVVATFEHATSRANDPLLHTHAVILSVSTRADKSSGTVVSHPLYVRKREIDRVYVDSLYRELHKVFGELVKRTADNLVIRGVSQEICAHFSKRRAAIVARLTKRGLSTSKAARIAALDTRPKKEIIPRKILFDRLQQSGRSINFGPEQALELVSRFRNFQDSNPKPASSVSAAHSQLAAKVPGSPARDDSRPVHIKQPPQSLARPFKQPIRHRKKPRHGKPVPLAERFEQRPIKQLDREVLTFREESLALARFSELSKSRTQDPPPRQKEIVHEKAKEPKQPQDSAPLAIQKVEQINRAKPRSAEGQQQGQHDFGPPPEFIIEEAWPPFEEAPAFPKAQSKPATAFATWFKRVQEWISVTPKIITLPARLHTFGQALIRIPLTKLELRLVERPMFPKAPAWSPVRGLKRLAIIRERFPVRHRNRFLVHTKTLLRVGSLTLELKSRLLAPKARQWSPLYGVRVNQLTIARRPSFKEIQALRQKLWANLPRRDEPRRITERILSR